MHDGVIWYDTFACFPVSDDQKGGAPDLTNLVGGVNTQIYVPRAPNSRLPVIDGTDDLTKPIGWTFPNAPISTHRTWSKGMTGPKWPDRRGEANPFLTTAAAGNEPARDAEWYRKGFPQPVEWIKDNTVDTVDDNEEYSSRVENWSTDIESVALNKLNWKKDIYIDLLKDIQELIDDCDLDCQSKGSQMTLIAGLNSLSLFFIMIQALLMFIGTWRKYVRIFQVYCNIFTCVFQLVILIVSGALLFTKYAAFCGKSVIRTAGWVQWTMKDDYDMTIMLWATQFIWMFIFFCCGLCSAHKSEKEYR
jgi:hypothetical protein